MKKRVLTVLALLLLLLLAAAVLAVFTSPGYYADSTAVEALDSDRVAVAETDYGWYFDGPAEDAALIFYPGANVEETAYAPLLHELADSVMDVCLVRMPLRLAFLGADNADGIISRYDYKHWYIGGHSLGGAVAANYAVGHDLDGVVLLAAYPTKAADEPMLLIYGSEDGVLNMDRVRKAKLFGTVEELVIDGGNHAGFGNYGEQKGDFPAAIPSSVQQEAVVSAVTAWLAEIKEETGDADRVPQIEAGIAEIKKTGSIVLSIAPKSMEDAGYEPADIISARIGNFEMEMPIGTDYTDVDSGEPICCFRTNSRGVEVVVLAINAGDLLMETGLAELHRTDADSGYEWVFAHGLDESVPVVLSMVQKQGYADEYAMHQLSGTRTNNRADYANLSDAEYANFRAVETNGMGTGTLFRSSSPVNPALNRNSEADEALLHALVRTVINMVDSEEKMKQYADYALTNYSSCSIIALEMGMDFPSEIFQQKFAEGMRFLIAHDGPYLIHCTEGKDRTGFAAAILVCLMGADADEVVRDYMLTYRNYYGIEPDTQQYAEIARSNLEVSLCKVFDISSIRDVNTDLSICAESWLRSAGMSSDEIHALKDKLAEDYGGLT